MPYVVVRGRTVILVPRYGVYDPRRNKPTELIAYSSRAQRLKLYYTYNYYILSKFQDFRVVQNTSTVTSYPYYPKGTTYMLTKLIYTYRSLSLITLVLKNNNDLHILMGDFQWVNNRYYRLIYRFLNIMVESL